MAGALSLQPWQWGVVAGVYLVFFAAPAVWMFRRARRDGESVFAWTLLVLVGSVMGIIEYYEHRSIAKRREKRARTLKSGDAERGPREEEATKR